MCAAGFFCRIEREDQCRRARLAGSGRAENGEVLAEQIVDGDHRRDRRILPDATHAHRVLLVAAEGEVQLLARGNAHPVAESGIDRHAAVERRGAAVRTLPTARRPGQARRSTARARPRAARAPARSTPRRWQAPPCWSYRWRTACPSRAAAWARAGGCRGRHARPRASRWPWSRSPKRCGRSGRLAHRSAMARVLFADERHNLLLHGIHLERPVLAGSEHDVATLHDRYLEARRQRHRHLGPERFGAADLELAAVQLHERLGNRQPKTGALTPARMTGIDLGEGRERDRDLRLSSCRRQYRGCVTIAPPSVSAVCTHMHRATGRRELHRSC